MTMSEIYNRRLFLHYADLDDPTTLRRVITKVAPDEIYHLAGQSHVGLSFEIPESTCAMTAVGTFRLLEIIRDLPNPPNSTTPPPARYSGSPRRSPRIEETPYQPVNPYGCAKAFATQMVKIYRQSHGLFACNGIMFNHESPRRGENFVTRKICRAAAAIKLGLETELVLGDTSAQRDWGDARAYVNGMWLDPPARYAGGFYLRHRPAPYRCRISSSGPLPPSASTGVSICAPIRD